MNFILFPQLRMFKIHVDFSHWKWKFSTLLSVTDCSLPASSFSLFNMPHFFLLMFYFSFNAAYYSHLIIYCSLLTLTDLHYLLKNDSFLNAHSRLLSIHFLFLNLLRSPFSRTHFSYSSLNHTPLHFSLPIPYSSLPFFRGLLLTTHFSLLHTSHCSVLTAQFSLLIPHFSLHTFLLPIPYSSLLTHFSLTAPTLLTCHLLISTCMYTL